MERPKINFEFQTLHQLLLDQPLKPLLSSTLSTNIENNILSEEEGEEEPKLFFHSYSQRVSNMFKNFTYGEKYKWQ